MDKTIEVVMVATVVVVTAGIVLYLVSDGASGFGEFLEEQGSSAECSLLETDFENADDAGERAGIETEARNQGCDTNDWTPP